MKRFVNILVAMSVAAFGVPVLVSSCVNPEYELSEDNINTDITVFQEGIVFPLGKTAPLTLGELFEQYGQDLKDYILNKDGKYGFSYAGSFDLSEDIAEIKDMLKINAFEIDQQFSFDLSSVSLDGLEILGSKISPDPIDVSAMVKIPNISIPEIHQSLQIKTGVEKPNVSDLDLNFGSLNKSYTTEFSSLKSEVNIPDLSGSAVWGQAMSYEDLSLIARQYRIDLPDMIIATGFDEITIDIPVKISLPNGIASVNQIELNPDANVEFGIKVLHPMFVEGEIIPKVEMDLKSIFHVDRLSNGVIDEVTQNIKDDFTLTQTTTPSWEANHVYYVDALALESSDWEKTDNGLVLDKTLSVKLKGEIENSGLKTSLKCLFDNGNNPMQIVMSLKFNDFSIDNVQMEIEPIVITQTLQVPIEVPAINLPEIVNEVEYVDLENAMNLTMQATLPDALKALNLEMESLEISFPDGIVVEHDNYTEGKLTYKHVSLSDGLNDAVTISRLNLPKPVNGSMSYNDNVVVTAKAIAGGMVNSKDLLDADKAGEVDVKVKVDYEPVLKDYSVVINDYPYIVNVNPVQINEKLPDEVGKMATVTVYPEGEPVIRIALDYPTADGAINIIPDKTSGLKIFFPEMLKFKVLPENYNYNPVDNSISFTGSQIIPNLIELPIDRIVIEPQLIEGDGYYVRGEMRVEGGVCLEGTKVNKTVVDALVAENASISFSAEVPTLRPVSLSLDQYVASIQETISLDMMEIAGIPEMIKSIDAVNLKNVYLSLEIDASSIVECIENVDLDLAFNVTLPKLIVVEGAQSGNTIRLSGNLNKDNKIVIDPIHIVGLDLSDIDLGGETITLGEQKIDIDGSISLKNVSLDLKDIQTESLYVAINGSLATSGSDMIELEKVEATVDYQLEPISQTISLAGLLDGFDDAVDFNLDLSRFHLALDLKTNLALPVKADIDFWPYYGGKVDESKKMSLPLSINWSLPANDTTHTKLWISNSEDDKPADTEYTHVALDLLSLVSDMPDSIKFNINAGTEPDAKFVIEPSADYVLKADYAFEVPLELGEDFRVGFSQVIEDLPEMINDVLGYGSLGLGGKIVNSLPIQLNLEFQLLDDAGNIIPLVEGAGCQTIKPCALDGSPQETELKVVLGIDRKAATTKATAIKLQFEASSRGASGIQFSEDCFIQAELTALVPEGVSLNIKDLMSEEDN